MMQVAELPMPVFRDARMERALHTEGFVKIPLLSDVEVAEIRAHYWGLVPPGESGLMMDYARPDRSIMADMSAFLEQYWERHLPDVFVDHRPTITTLVVKHPGAASQMFLHEDGTFVDERHHFAGTLWIPLVDIGPGNPNGGLRIIPRSHHLVRSLSGTRTPDVMRPYDRYLRQFLEPVDLSAGSAIFYDSRLIHESPANMSAAPREAIVCGLAPRDAALIHVVATGRRTRQIFEVDEQFWLKTHPHELGEHVADLYPLVAEVEEVDVLTPERVAEVVGAADLPVPEPVVPHDVAATLPAELGMISPLDGTGPSLDRDPVLTMDALAIHDTIDPGRLGGISVEDRAGTCIVARLADVSSAGDLPSEIEQKARIAAEGAFASSLLLVLPAGGRLHLSVPPGDAHSLVLHALECPSIGAGFAYSDGVAMLDNSLRFAVDPGPVAIWNDGPGPAVLVLVVPEPIQP